jgi:1-pyrroline-5-carboxylate dehydrogenase
VGIFHNEATFRQFLESGREQEFDELFDAAVQEAQKNEIGQNIPMQIGGREVYADSEIEEVSPIDRKTIVGRFQKGTREHARIAIDAAQEAFADWRYVNYKDRIKIFERAAGLFSEKKFLISAVLSIENGKTRYESIGEIDEAVDFLRYYAHDLAKNKGYTSRTQLPGSGNAVNAGFQGAPGAGERISVVMKPYGVFGVIAPFNFPISISVGMSSGAVITGNAVVFKPSSTDSMSMLSGYKIFEIFREAGVPEGVFNYITGPGSEVGDELVASKKVSGIAFTGSRAAGAGMLKRVYGEGGQKVFVLEMGGKNPAIVSERADLSQAVDGIAGSAFGFSGQKCSACSRVYVHKSVKSEFVRALVEKIHSLKIGNPLNKDVYLGPLISKDAIDNFSKYVEEARKEGKIVCGGKIADVGLGGFYAEPTIVEADHKSALFHRELFVPILLIAEYTDFNDAIDKANDSEYGLTAGLYSRKRQEIKKFFSSIDAGVAYVNREVGATTGAIVGAHTFVGWKSSGLTGKGSGSRFYLQQFMHEQSMAEVK